MHIDELKSVQLILLTLVTVYTQGVASFWAILFLMPITLVIRDYYYINTALSILIIIVGYLSTLTWWFVGVAIVNLGLCYLLQRQKSQTSRRGIKTVFLICVGLTTMHQVEWINIISLVLFYGMLILQYLQLERWFVYGVKFYRVLLPASLIWMAGGHTLFEGQQQGLMGLQHSKWWYYLAFTLGTFYASLLRTSKISNTDAVSSVEMIEMRDMNNTLSLGLSEHAITPEDSADTNNAIKMQKVESQHQGKVKSSQQLEGGREEGQLKKVKSDEKLEASKDLSPSLELKPKYRPETQSAKQQQHRPSRQDQGPPVVVIDSPKSSQQSTIHEQRDSLNLILIIPFCLADLTFLQLIIYFYVLSIQWNRPNKYITICMLLTAGIITAKDGSGMQGIVLRVLGTLLVSKELQGGQILGVTIRSFWLKSSFAVVLLLLFWFSLLTVNIFHLLFIIVVLLFVIKSEPEHQHSYRHRNWKYLQFLFNSFLILRLIYVLVNAYGLSIPNSFKAILDITGISYIYTQGQLLFNFVPLLINAAIGFQYLTYNSAIYETDNRQSILESYQDVLNRIGTILRIIYYKLLPWVSYLIILGILVSYDFSLSSWGLLGWMLTTLAVHLMSKHDLPGYKRMNLLWIGFMRLTSLQIVLRFAFEFIKFGMFRFLRQFSFFQWLIRYEELLGLAIPRQEVVYFKAISRFQLMVSLDLASIFVAFLVQEYYQLLINYLELPKEEEREQSQQKVAQIYNKYIDFKVTNWLSGFSVYPMLRIGCDLFLEFYYPFVGIVACLKASIVMGMYLLVGLKFYLNVNLAYYKSHVGSALMLKVLEAVKKWRLNQLMHLVDQIRALLEQARKIMQSMKVKQHDRLRFWMVLISCLSVMLVHFSKGLKKQEVEEIAGQNLVLNMRWWLYVGGCSVQYGLMAHFSKLLLILIVIEKKCCWFMQRFYIVQIKRPELEEDAQAEQVLTKKEIELNGDESHQLEDIAESDRDAQSRLQLNWQSGTREQQVVQMRVSLLFGSVKLMQRSLVMVLILASLIQMSHPFGMLYLLCAILLNYLGSFSIKAISRILFVLITIQYFLLLVNYTNQELRSNIPQDFQQFQNNSLLHELFRLPPVWEDYLTFGKSAREIAVMLVSWILLCIYPLYFRVLRWAGRGILQLLEKKIQLSPITQKLIDYIQQIYSYGLGYSPLVIMLLCLKIYFLDYTITNLMLTALTVGFIFLSFLVRDYKDSRQFWRTYFVVLQLMIVVFMITFTLLQLPMLSQYCTKLICTTQQFHTQLYKALLLLILQLGLDLTHSHHFDRALGHLRHSKKRADLQRIAIAQRHNDRKIMQHFKGIHKQKQVESSVRELEQFLKDHKVNPQKQFGWRGQNYETKESWLDLVLDLLPQIVDKYLLLGEKETRNQLIINNDRYMTIRGIHEEELSNIHDLYIDQFADLDQDNLLQAIQMFKDQPLEEKSLHLLQNPDQEGSQRDLDRTSYMNEYLPHQTRELVDSMNRRESKDKHKQELLYLLLVESIFSNWHYITYFVLIMVHIKNLGLLTFPIPVVVFCCGLVSSQRAGKKVWRALLALVMIPVLFKFCIGTGIITCDPELQYLLISQELDSMLLEYLSIVFIVGECVVLKLMGQWDETTQQIECMRMALVRNIINSKQQQQQQQLYEMLKKSDNIPITFAEMIFGRSELKVGYDYSTLLTAIQLIVLVWVFLFYDRMAVRQEVTFYSMIEYNQFSSGMVVLTLLQLLFLLAQRFIAISDLRQLSSKWQVGLVLKYILLMLNLVMMEGVVLLYFPLSSDRYTDNTYITVLIALSLMNMLVQALQIKKGLDRTSKGFMDRYTWYNGFVYQGYRAIPFLFEFKMFSDWTFTKTSLRIFDWIRFQEIFGRMYVAKCSALFMSGKKLGAKIQWWKKLLMGYPLLLSIILLLFGPLVLFSGLNPLASLNDVTAGYLEIVLRVNRTNQYPLYTNSHITDIHRLNASQYDLNLLDSYDIEDETVQMLHLQSFSDQYWQISEGSYQKLLEEPENSLYELTVRARFDRNLTGLTSLYILSSTQVDTSRISQLKDVLKGQGAFCVEQFVNPWIRLDNNNGLHLIGNEKERGCLESKAGVRAQKQYWVLQNGLDLRVASDKYTQAIFGYSVMSFYISIILVIANYFRFLFQGSVHNITYSDIPHPDPVLALCNAIYASRNARDLQREDELFWMTIDLLRTPDTLKALTGDYLDARLDTLKEKQQ